MDKTTKQILIISWPIMLQGLVTTIILFTDRLLLGNYSSTALASTGISGVLIWSVFMLFSSYNTGILAISGRAYGAQDLDKIKITALIGISFAIVIGLIISFIGYTFSDTLTELMAGSGNDSSEIRSLATTYLTIVFTIAPFKLIALIGTSIIQTNGDTKTPMIISIVSAIFNAITSYLLIFGLYDLPELGVHGAALGTAAAFIIQGILIFYVLVKKLDLLKFTASINYQTRLYTTSKQIIKISQPTFMERLVYQSAYITFASFVGHLGETALAAHQAAMAIESIGYIAADSFSVAASVLVSQKLGANKQEEAFSTGLTTGKLSVKLLALLGVFYLLLHNLIVRLFSDDIEIIQLGGLCIFIAGFAQPIMALAETMSDALRGAGDTKTPMVAVLVSSVCIRLTIAWLLAYYFNLGLIGIWIGSTTDWLVRATWLTIAYNKGLWLELKV